MDTLTVAAWNILYDKVGRFNAEPQASRQASIMHTLSSAGPRFDIVGLLEVENNKEAGHHGENIARSLQGVDGHWVTHSVVEEDMGIFGTKIEKISTHDLADNRTMVIAHTGELAIGLIHFTFDMFSDRVRSQQARQALDCMATYDKAILMGDFNSASWQRSRKLIESAGFTSVFHALKRRRPPTILTEKYRQRLPLKYKMATKYGFSPDVIYIRGVDVVDAGVFEGDSDHRGVWAQIKSS